MFPGSKYLFIETFDKLRASDKAISCRRYSRANSIILTSQGHLFIFYCAVLESSRLFTSNLCNLYSLLMKFASVRLFHSSDKSSCELLYRRCPSSRKPASFPTVIRLATDISDSNLEVEIVN